MASNSGILQLGFREDIALGLEFIPIDDHYARTQKNLRIPHRASFYLIFWFKKGTPVHTIDFHPIKPLPDSFLFVRKDAVQIFDQQNTFESSTLLFTDTFFCENESDHRFLQSSPLFNDFVGDQGPVLIIATEELQTIWQGMQAEGQHQVDPFHAALLRKYLYSFMLLSEREHFKQWKSTRLQGVNFELFLNFNNLLEQNFRTEKSIGFYAEKLSISLKVLTNITQLMVGKTPKQLIDERIVLEAKRLLVHSYNPVKAIGFFLGFDEPTNFNKFFRKHCGQTPAVFRDSFLPF